RKCRPARSYLSKHISGLVRGQWHEPGWRRAEKVRSSSRSREVLRSKITDARANRRDGSVLYDYPMPESGKPIVERKPGDQQSGDLTERSLHLRIRQQEILAELGVLALQGTKFMELLNHVV